MRFVLIFFGICAALLLAQARRTPAAPKAHPRIGPTMECAMCHDDQAAAWSKSKHGLALMKCVGCHSHPSENFTAKPASTVCRSCHAAEFESAKTACTSCHPPHALRYHPAKGAK